MVLLQKLTARVFGASRGIGGNPVTIFLPKGNEILSSVLEQSLAKSCEWESVLIQQSKAAAPPHLKFFVPSGNELSFCAHAAIGAAYAIHQQQSPQTGGAAVSFQMGTDEPPQTAHIMDNGDIVFLDLQNVSYDETRLDLVYTESILDQLGLEMMNVLNYPLNAAIAGRPKTLVQMPLDVLQVETKSAPVSAIAFRDNCILAEGSTGLYVYAETADASDDTTIELEARQFPSDSGYPEDPATGIAAAALAVRLAKQSSQDSKALTYQIAQGTAMGRPSRITIQNIVFHDDATKSVSLQCGGRVEIDDTEEIQV